MVKILFFLSFSGVLLSCSHPSMPIHTSVKVPDGYYAGSDKLFKVVFLKVASDTAIADFIYVEKFPRDLDADTLLYDRSNNVWIGRTSKVFQKKGRYYISINSESSIFGKTDIKIKSDEAVYKKNINVDKNYAFWNKEYISYIEKSASKQEARNKFNKMGEKYEISKIMETATHEDFLKTYEKIKSELISE